MVPVGARTVAWLFLTPPRCARAQAASAHQLGCHVVVQHLGSLPVHVQDAQHGFPVVLVAVEGAHPVGQPGRSPVGVSGHQGGDSGGH